MASKHCVEEIWRFLSYICFGSQRWVSSSAFWSITKTSACTHTNYCNQKLCLNDQSPKVIDALKFIWQSMFNTFPKDLVKLDRKSLESKNQINYNQIFISLKNQKRWFPGKTNTQLCIVTPDGKQEINGWF